MMRTLVFVALVAGIAAKLQVRGAIPDPCEGIVCGNLVCPGGSKLAEYPGHCCPYCESTVVIKDDKDYAEDAAKAFATYKTAKYAGGTGLVQANKSKTPDPCEGMVCGNLVCPGGSKLAEYPGHCCPYCESTVVIKDDKDYAEDAAKAFATYKTAKYAGGTGLVQANKSTPMVDPCKGMVCGNLVCPGGSKLAEYPGHCCPYCESTVMIKDDKDYAEDAAKAFATYKTAKYAGGTGLVQANKSKTPDPCEGIVCGNLVCPGGSKIAEYPGHCCPYCESTVVIKDDKDYAEDAAKAFATYKTAKYAGGTGF